jgi:hypothetical protein
MSTIDYLTGLIDRFIDFSGVFILFMAIFYIMSIVLAIVKILVLKEGKLEMSVQGVAILLASLSYIFAYIIC